MYRALMFIVGLIYLGASISAVFDKKWMWSVVFLCWGIGNLALFAIALSEE